MTSKTKFQSVDRPQLCSGPVAPRDALPVDDLRIRQIIRMFGGSLELVAVRAELAFTVRPAR